jgi:hypothetical protein
VLLLVIAVVVGFAARVAVVRDQPAIKFQWIGLLGGAFVVQLFVGRLTGLSRGMALGISVVSAIAWLVRNLVGAPSAYVRSALLIFSIGAAMNAGPIITYGKMPVDRQALHDIGYTDRDNSGFRASKHLIVEKAPFLGDRFAMPALRTVGSLGDFVEMVGIAGLVAVIPKRNRYVQIRRATFT